MQIDVKVTYKNNKLQQLRHAAGLSQSQLAKLAGINLRMIQYYEQGAKDLNVAKLTTLLRLCNALNCVLSDILTDPEVLDLLRVYESTNGSADERV